MSESTQEQNPSAESGESGVTSKSSEGAARVNTSRRKWPLLAALIVILLSGSAIAIFFWPRPGGKPVPAPRTVSFDEPSNQPVASDAERTLTLTPEQTRGANLKIETVGEQVATDAAAGQTATGIVQANSYKETPIVSLVGGIVRQVDAQLGQNLRRGQKVATIFSNELAEAQSRYVSGIAALNEHHQHHERTMKLVEIGAASRQELDTAMSEYREAEASLANLRQKLLLLGMTRERIDGLTSTNQISSEFTVESPANGTITSRTVNPGEVIDANKELMRVTDLSTVWVIAQVYERDLATVRVGSGANVTSDAYPGRIFRGRVAYVDPKIDSATRTAQVRIELANPRQVLKIGMYVQVDFGSQSLAERTAPVVPKEAVQTIGNQQIVFVATADPNQFLLRPVRVGAETNGSYPVLEGLTAGDRVVTSGSVLLRAEWLKVHPGNE